MNKRIENEILNDREFNERLPVLKSKPKRLIVNLSTRCNSRCIMCEVRHKTWDMPEKTIAEVKELLPTLNCVMWQGGEMFYLDYFEGLFNAASECEGLKQTITTNGLLLDERWIEKLARARVELALSIDGTSKEVYEKIRSGSSFDRFISRVELLRKLAQGPGKGISLRMHVVVMRSNYKQLTEFIEFAERYGFENIHLMPLIGSKAPDENIFTPEDTGAVEEVRDLLAKAYDMAKSRGLLLMDSLPLRVKHSEVMAEDEARTREDNSFFCSLPWQQLNLDPGGEVRPGCSCATTVGSIYDKSLMELWNCEGMQKYRSTLADGSFSQCSKSCIRGDVPAELRRTRNR